MARPVAGHLRLGAVVLWRRTRALATEVTFQGPSHGPSCAPPRTLTLIGKNREKEQDATVLPAWLLPTLLSPHGQGRRRQTPRVLLDSTDGRAWKGMWIWKLGGSGFCSALFY